MQPTSIDVLCSALADDDATAQLGELSSPDGAFTLLFCEIANIGAIRRTSTPESIATLLEDQRMIVQRIVSSHGAAIARAHEDGYMIVSDSAHAGLRCAIEIQRSFTSLTPEQAGTALQLRIGLHTGAVIAGGDDIYGRNVLLGARIATHAAGGEILVSAKAKEYTQSDSSFHFIAHGEQHFKGLHGEHELFAVSWEEPGSGSAQL
jgi:adenylate cyclase